MQAEKIKNKLKAGVCFSRGGNICEITLYFQLGYFRKKQYVSPLNICVNTAVDDGIDIERQTAIDNGNQRVRRILQEG